MPAVTPQRETEMTEFSTTYQPADGDTKGQGPKRRKIVTDALMLALNREIEAEGKMTKRINILADKVVLKAIEGDVPAFNAVADRIEGKPSQALEHTGNDGGPVVFTWKS